MTTPGFTADASFSINNRGHGSFAGYHFTAEPQVLPAQASVLERLGGPFSGSCGCGPGFCCCIFCYYERYTFWCSSTILSPY
jgi:hypothetical protein